MTAGTTAAPSFEPVVQAAAADALPQRRLSRQVAADTVAIGDFLAVVMGGLLPGLIYAVAGGIEINHLVLLQSTILAGFISHLCLRFRGMYATTHMDAFPQDPIELLIAVCCGLIGVLGIGLPLALNNMHLIVWYASWLSASFTLILLARLAARAILADLFAKGRFNQRIAVFGAGQIARRVHDYLQLPNLGIYFSGVYDDRIGQDRLNPEGLAVAGRLDDLINAAREGKIDRIIIALPQSANERLGTIVDKFSMLPVSTHIVTHIASDLIETDAALNVSNLGPVGLLDVKKKH